jgi:hypothetical protein
MADEVEEQQGIERRPRGNGALPVGLIAAASAVVGGLAVAWWHRRTLERLVNAPHPERVVVHREDEFDE